MISSFLQSHPFAVEAFFESSLVLTFAIPKEELFDLIPECLELDTFEDKWAFVAVAMVQTKDLRPKGFPKLLGNDFFLIGYRVFVKYYTNSGKRLRGLYILKSETNKKKMQFFGNIFTKYQYTTTDIARTTVGTNNIIKSIKSDFRIEIERENKEEILLPENSPFTDLKQARRFSGPLPFTFTFDPKTRKVLIIEGVRQNWQPKPIKVINYDISFLKKLNFKEIHLANAFVIENIPYYWKKGKTEQWNG